MTDPWGWGAALSNWPGFSTTAGVKKLSFWGKLGSGTSLQPRMIVKWLDRNQTVLQTNELRSPALTTEWQQSSVLADAPEGASTVLVSIIGSGNPGDYFYLDDIAVGDAPNALDADTAGGETSAGQWQSWYSASVTASTSEAHRGTGSLRVDVDGPWGWGIVAANWPGFTASAGNKRVSYWAMQGTGSLSEVTLRVKWLDRSQTLLQTDVIPLSGLSTNWQQAVANLAAPSGTANVYLEIYSPSGVPGDSLYLDELVITDGN